MKLLRYGPKGAEKPGLLDLDGNIRDLSSLLADITPQTLSPEGLCALRALGIDGLPTISSTERLGIPFCGAGKIICAGLNYRDHAKETGQPIPDEPVLFLKATSSLNGPNDPVVLPRNSKKSDWEVELAVVIGKTARNVDRSDALSHVGGYCIMNDLSEREFQLERGGQWDKGKGCDTFGPIGPWLVTPDEISAPQELDMWLEVNGHRVQSSNTQSMVFDVSVLVSYVSQFMTLYPGDIISTGTPAGVGHGHHPPTYLKPGDRIRLGIAGLGEQMQQVVAWDPTLLN
jgi:2-keto-4-pentenoate hydratase/2-oxohepta-3-ene-1,7-dioic acid hydratase in catechol pathway